MSLNRRAFLTTSSAALAAGTLGRFMWPGFTLGASGPFGSAQGQQQAPAPVVTEIRRNVGTFVASGGTIGWLVNGAGAVAVDSQFPNTATLAVDELLKRSAKTSIGMLINSHHHGDHTGGNGVFRPKTPKIVGHVNVPKYMKDTYDRTMAQRAAANPAPTNPPPADPVIPDTTFADKWQQDFGDEVIRAKYYGPAHTGGDIVTLFEKANVAHMGDLMFNRAHPVIDRANGASISNWTLVLRQVASELPADTIYIFGHAGANLPVTGSRADLLHHADYLAALLEYVRAQVKAGKTRDEVIALREVIKGFEDYGPLIARPLGPAYDEVTAGGRL
jgi:glyoxylase-like metal-dependent hydrolase (beta-lactamase superfamily II)